MSTRFIVIRHGETHWNREGRIQGHLDSALTEEGSGQAEAVAERLAKQNVDVLYSSDLGRARQTARRIAERCGLDILTDRRLREKNLGVFQGLTATDMKAQFPVEYARYLSREPSFVIPGGESARQFFDRTVSCFEDLASRTSGGTVVVVTHGGVLGCLYRHVGRMPLDAARDFSLLNASFNAFRYDSGTWTKEVWGDVSHLTRENTLDEL
jgi:probable phosphoglycerate mutase